jgi:hypothetical protein
MTGPEHYREAEQLLEQARASDVGGDMERYSVAAAQVHATLALAAATAADVEDQSSRSDWRGVIL